MKLLNCLVAFALIASVTGLLSVVSPCRRSSRLCATQLDGRDSRAILENDDYELMNSEVDLERVKKFVSEKALEEHKMANKVFQREMR